MSNIYSYKSSSTQFVSQEKFCQILKKQISPMPFKVFQSVEKEEKRQNYVYEDINLQ